MSSLITGSNNFATPPLRFTNLVVGFARLMVEAFHRTFEITVNPVPTVADKQTCGLRVTLIQEEFDELKQALVAEDLSSIAKEMADLLYVVYGTAVSYGIDMMIRPPGRQTRIISLTTLR